MNIRYPLYPKATRLARQVAAKFVMLSKPKAIAMAAVTSMGIGVLMGGGIAHAYTSVVNGIVTIQGELPAPAVTATGQTGGACNQNNQAAIAANIAAQQAALTALQTTSAPAASAVSSCMGGLSSMVIPTLSINTAMIGQALKNAACQAVSAQIAQYSAPLYNAYGQYNPSALLGQATSKMSGMATPGSAASVVSGIAAQGIQGGIVQGSVAPNAGGISSIFQTP